MCIYFNMNPKSSRISASGRKQQKPELFTILLDELTSLIKRHSEPRFIEQFGIGMKEYRMLRVIYREPGLSQGALQRALWFEKTSTSRLLSSLVKKGFVTRTIGTEDARVTNVSVTDAGAKILDGAYAAARGEADRLLKGVLSDAEIDTFYRVTNHLLEHVRYEYRDDSPERGGDPAL